MSDVKTLRAALDTEVKALSELIDDFAKPESTAVKVDGSNVEIDQKAYEAASGHKTKIAQLKLLLGLGDEVKGAKSFLDGEGEETSRFSAPAAEYKSVADMLIESDEFKDMIANNRTQMAQDVQINERNIVGRKDVYSAMASWSPTYNIATRVQTLPTITTFGEKARVRDLFPAASTNSNLLEYWIQNGLDNNGRGWAAPVAERTGDNTNFGLKPKSDISFTHATDPIRTIAHWIPAHRNTLADAPQLRSLIDNALLYGLAEEEDFQLLNGDGAGENILGLLRRPGLQSYVAGGGELKTDSLRKALTLSELAGFPSTGYVLHPLDWEDVELQRGTTNDHYMVTTNVAVGIQERVWRTPVVSSVAISEGTFLSAAFGRACQIYDRERANIRVAEQHADFFIRNAVVILAEERLGLAVQNPGAVVVGEFAA